MNQVLTLEQSLQKIKRIAFEIYENNYSEEELFLAGIEGTGWFVAEKTAEYLREISDIKVNLFKISLDKTAPLQSEIKMDYELHDLEEKCLVLVDDVLYTGRTLAYALRPFLSVRVKKLQVAILIDRNYRKFPVAADYVGYELATTLENNILVQLDDERQGVFIH